MFNPRYHGACKASRNGRSLDCQEDAEQTSGLRIGDQVQHAWESSVTALCHAQDEVGERLGAVTTIAGPDPMIARGTVCGFDGSLALIHWDYITNTRRSIDGHNGDDSCGGCDTELPGDNPLVCGGDFEGAPCWTRFQDGDVFGGQCIQRDVPAFLAAWMGDPGANQRGMAETCGVAPQLSELRGAIPPFELGKLACSNYPAECTELAPEVIDIGGKPGKGGHRRAQAKNESLEADPETSHDDNESSRRSLQGMGIRARRPKPGHQGIDSVDTETCALADINALAENVEADCCYQNGVFKCTSESGVPEGCSYACGAVLIPFVDACHDILADTFATQLAALTQLYDSCLNADQRVLRDAYDSRDCCTAANCGGCKSAESCGALEGQCAWGPGTPGRQIDSMCNCRSPGEGFFGQPIAQSAHAFPDFAACSAACQATDGCQFFAVFEETPGDTAFPDCKPHDACFAHSQPHDAALPQIVVCGTTARVASAPTITTRSSSCTRSTRRPPP